MRVTSSAERGASVVAGALSVVVVSMAVPSACVPLAYDNVHLSKVNGARTAGRLFKVENHAKSSRADTRCPPIRVRIGYNRRER